MKDGAMSEIVQWLNEIKDLKQQLQEARQAEEAAHASADNWRKRYEIEAQQRRTEAELMQQTIGELRSQLAIVQNLPQPSADAPIAQAEIEQTVEHLDSVADLKAKLLEIWAERDRLAHDLKVEQTEHAQTRKNLTTALGDAVDMLKTLRPND
jgi:hypothetical protein